MGDPFPRNLAAQKRQNVGGTISHNFATWSRISLERRLTRHRQSENGLQTVDTPAQANLIRCTLVHKRLKIGPEFWPIQRAAITLGSATHLVVLYVARRRMEAELCLQHHWLSQDVTYMRAKRLSTVTHRKFILRRKWQVITPLHHYHI